MTFLARLSLGNRSLVALATIAIVLYYDSVRLKYVVK
jgi:hypothetical protein